MGILTATVSALGARRLLSGLGGFYVLVVASYPFLPFVAEASNELWIVLGILVGVPGLMLLYGGYRLPETSIQPAYYTTVGTWCLRGIAVGVAVLIPILLPSSNAEILANTLLVTALGGLAGFGAGSYDARAKSRTHELRETVEQLETSNERLERHQTYTEAVLDSIDDVFYVVDEESGLERWNESLSEVTGYTDEEIAALSVGDFFPDDDRQKAFEAIRDGFETGSTHTQLDVRTKDGRTIPFEFIGSTVQDPSGDTVLAGIARDVSDRIERERRLEQLVERLEASNERLEQFAYAASHDLQEPLRMVSSYLQLIEQRYEEDLDDDGREFLHYAVDGADRMRDMIEGLLEYSRVETQGDPFEPVDLEVVLDDALEDLRLQIGESDAEITVEDLPVVEGDPRQLRQVFQNLLANAIEYSGDEPPMINVSAARNGSKWHVAVRDEGPGIEPEDQERIFDVFQRLHDREQHSGTGIGLALCERIVERHDGDIWVDSEPGEGATFTVSIPAADDR